MKKCKLNFSNIPQCTIPEIDYKERIKSAYVLKMITKPEMKICLSALRNGFKVSLGQEQYVKAKGVLTKKVNIEIYKSKVK